MGCQGAQEETEGMLGAPGDLKTARGGSPLALLSLPGSPGLPSVLLQAFAQKTPAAWLPGCLLASLFPRLPNTPST